ncbi:MAG: PhoU domain-containing protein [Candidatus Woesearchaeota archaeon]
MHIRKLVKAGQASHTISLPKEWLEKNKLSKGATIYVYEKSDSELLITPTLTEKKPTEQNTVTINVDNKQPDTIQREISAAYLNNASTIELVGESITKHAKEIRRMLHDFVALEISEQNANKIIAKDLLNLKEISVDKSIKRMDMITRTMLQDCRTTVAGKDLSESVMFRDYDVNRLYFLLTRLLKSALASPEMASLLALEPAKVLGTWMLVHYIEGLADAVKALCKECSSLNGGQKKTVNSLLSLLEQDYLDVMKAVHEGNRQLADEVARRRSERLELCTKINQLPEVSHACSSIASILSDIARLVIDEN